MISNILIFLGGFLSLTSFVHYFLLMHWFFGSFPASFVSSNRTMFCLHIKFCLLGSKLFYAHLGVPRKTKQLCFFYDTKSDFFLTKIPSCHEIPPHP